MRFTPSLKYKAPKYTYMAEQRKKEQEKRQVKKAQDKYIFDLRGYINNELNSLKVENIENVEMDTYKKKEFFYCII